MIGFSFECFNFNNFFNLGVYDLFIYGGGFFGFGFLSVQVFVDSVLMGGFDDEFVFVENVFKINGGDDGVEGEGWVLVEINLG